MEEVVVRAALRLKAPSPAVAVGIVKGFLLRGTFWEGLDEAGHDAGVSLARVERVVAHVEADPSDAYMAWLMRKASAALVLTAHLRDDPVRHAAALIDVALRFANEVPPAVRPDVTTHEDWRAVTADLLLMIGEVCKKVAGPEEGTG